MLITKTFVYVINFKNIIKLSSTVYFIYDIKYLYFLFLTVRIVFIIHSV